MEQTILPTVAADLPLAPEVPVELLVNGTKLATLMCTPLNLDDLALGHLVGRGMLADLATVLSVGACADLRQANVICGEGLLADRYGLAAVIASGCGSGGALRTATELPPLAAAAGARVSLELLQGYARRMFEAAELYRKTGGMHCAALLGPPLAAGGSDRATGGEPAAERFFVVREDVGLHNAVDKVLGSGFRRAVPLTESVILTSGRIASDMILKAIAAGVAVIVSRSIPTSSAFELAKRAGVTIVGRIEKSKPLVYCGGQRIVPA
ncbi:MAG TPA: formate dehydrogenase accessory sulfurtransferase FdhD [Spirochaetaceae bacterium]|nr:formate dehydrogenase accessory sulfurtransferase FdhD [Spirochaetaceae bacterium]